MPARRTSIVRYETDCHGFPIPGRTPLRVPIAFDFRIVRANIEKVLDWMISRVTGGSGQLVLGPQFRYVDRGARGEPDYELYTPDGATALHPTPELARAAINQFVAAVMRPRLATKRLGTATLRWMVRNSRHRSVVLCDGRDESVFKVYVIDPNGSLVEDTKEQVFVLLRGFFRSQDVAPKVKLMFLPIEHMNASADPITRGLDRLYGIEWSEDPGGYCVPASLLLILDVLCAKEQALTKGHISRLVKDLSGNATDHGAKRYNLLMAMRSFTFELATLMTAHGHALPTFDTRTIPYIPIASLPPLKSIRDALPRAASPPPRVDNPRSELWGHTVSALRVMCEERGLGAVGTKAALVARLMQA